MGWSTGQWDERAGHAEQRTIGSELVKEGRDESVLWDWAASDRKRREGVG